MVLLSMHFCPFSGYFEKRWFKCLHIDPCCAFKMHSVMLKSQEIHADLGELLMRVNRALCIFTLSNLTSIHKYKWGSLLCCLYAGKTVVVFFFCFQNILWWVACNKNSVDQMSFFFFIDTSTTPVLSLRKILTSFRFILLKIKKMHVLWQSCRS